MSQIMIISWAYFITLTNAAIPCPISHDNYISNKWCVSGPDSRKKQFIVLRYHVTCNNKCAHKSQDHKNTRSYVVRPSEEPPFQVHLPDPLLPFSPSYPSLINFINQYKYKMVRDSAWHDQESVSRISVSDSEYSVYHDSGNIKW